MPCLDILHPAVHRFGSVLTYLSNQFHRVASDSVTLQALICFANPKLSEGVRCFACLLPPCVAPCRRMSHHRPVMLRPRLESPCLCDAVPMQGGASGSFPSFAVAKSRSHSTPLPSLRYHCITLPSRTMLSRCNSSRC